MNVVLACNCSPRIPTSLSEDPIPCLLTGVTYPQNSVKLLRSFITTQSFVATSRETAVMLCLQKTIARKDPPFPDDCAKRRLKSYGPDANSVSISEPFVLVEMRTRLLLLTGKLVPDKAFIGYILSVLGSSFSTLQDLYNSVERKDAISWASSDGAGFAMHPRWSQGLVSSEVIPFHGLTTGHAATKFS